MLETWNADPAWSQGEPFEIRASSSPCWLFVADCALDFAARPRPIGLRYGVPRLPLQRLAHLGLPVQLVATPPIFQLLTPISNG